MPLPLLRGLFAALLLLVPPPLHAQYEHRIWGRVFTGDDEVHEGFIHVTASRSGGSWADVLLASKEIPDEYYQDWLDAARAGERYTRVLELKGYRITWVEEHPAFVGASRAGVRFGHLAKLTFDDEARSSATIRPRNAAGFPPDDTVTRHASGNVNIESAWRRADVWVDGGDGPVEVPGRNIRMIEFGPAPDGRAPTSRRLYGTVEDRSGRSFTGFVTWNRRMVLDSHVLDGFWEDVPELASPWRQDEFERSFPFSDIRSLERTPCFAKVTLKSGPIVELCNEPMAPDPRPVQISDPALGLIEVEWDAVRILRFEPSPGVPGYGAFDGGKPLSGTVVTVDGEEIAGRIRWDADEEWSWELLQGSSNDVEFSIEFGNIAHIAREESEGARVTLRDGRSFHLAGENDVGRQNRGIFIFPAPAEEGAADPADGAVAGKPVPEWRYVAWEDFREVRFDAVEAEEPGS